MGFWLGIIAAIGIGALHSLEPGHGKGVLTAYLISSKANVFKAVLLGILSAAGHTISLLMLAFLATSLKVYSLGAFIQWIELASGFIILLIGTNLLANQVSPRIVVVEKVGAGAVEPTHHHHHPHLFRHPEEKASSAWQLFTIGLFTGLIPCPSAVAVFLAAIGANQLQYGLAYAVAFSIGTALTMILMGIMVVRLGHAVESLEKSRYVHLLGIASSLCILCLGSYVFFQALRPLLSQFLG